MEQYQNINCSEINSNTLHIPKPPTAFYSSQNFQLYISSANVTNYGLPKIRYVVPKSEMSENCRLHIKIFTGNDYCGHRAATIYCGTPTSGKRLDRHDQGFDDFAVGGFGRWSIGLRTSTKPIFQINS